VNKISPSEKCIFPLPTHFPWHLTPYRRIWGSRLSLLKTWQLQRLLKHNELASISQAGLRAAIRAELGFRTMREDQMKGRP
jgi:hypothetical protein